MACHDHDLKHEESMHQLKRHICIYVYIYSLLQTEIAYALQVKQLSRACNWAIKFEAEPTSKCINMARVPILIIDQEAS